MHSRIHMHTHTQILQQTHIFSPSVLKCNVCTSYAELCSCAACSLLETFTRPEDQLEHTFRVEYDHLEVLRFRDLDNNQE